MSIIMLKNFKRKIFIYSCFFLSFFWVIGFWGSLSAKAMVGPICFYVSSWECIDGEAVPIEDMVFALTCPQDAPKPSCVPINGVCGSDNGTTSCTTPKDNLCLAGSASNVDASADQNLWSWNCQGSLGGSTANCSATLPLGASCGSANGGSFCENSPPFDADLCSVGYPTYPALVSFENNSFKEWMWQCKSPCLPEGTNADCRANFEAPDERCIETTCAGQPCGCIFTGQKDCTPGIELYLAYPDQENGDSLVIRNSSDPEINSTWLKWEVSNANRCWGVDENGSTWLEEFSLVDENANGIIDGTEGTGLARITPWQVPSVKYYLVCKNDSPGGNEVTS